MNNQQTDNKAKYLVKELLGWVAYIAVVCLLMFFIINFVGQRTRVEGDSMNPALHNGDNLIVEKISYRFNDPDRYDIIIFPYAHAENVYYIKRIIGMPGETIQITDGYVYINGELLDEHYGAERMITGGIAEEPIELGEDEYFVLGDNRNHSADSRDPSVGVLTKDDLIGRAWVRIYPFDDMEVLTHE